jgi:parallel beta-helix repeat protein
MKKRRLAALLVGLSCLLVVFSSSVLSGVTSEGGRWYVGGSGSGNFTRIQDAINQSSDGDTIYIYSLSSPYYESLMVNRNLSLVGEQKETTVIDGGDANTIVFLYNTSRVTNLTIIGGYVGVYLHADDCEITNNILKNSFFCIDIDSDNNRVRQNHIIHQNFTGYGILVNGVENYVSWNIIENTTKAGIDIDNKGYNSRIEHNTLRGAGIESQGNKNTISNNTLDGQDLNEIGMFLNGLNSNTVMYNRIEHYTFSGISIESGYGNFIFKNIVSSNKNGIIVKGRTNIIMNNDFLKNNHSAFFYLLSFFNIWKGNYWNRGLILPHVIIGRLFFSIIPWLNVDWRPALQPNVEA